MPSQVLQTCPRCRRDLPESDWSPSRWGLAGGWCRTCSTGAQYLRLYRLGKVRFPFKIAYWRACEACDTGFQSPRHDGRFCSRRCKDRAKNAACSAELAAKKVKIARFCPHCGGELDWQMRSDARFCSQTCEQAAHNMFRKALKRGARNPDRGISRDRVMKRCKGKCHLCGKKAVRPTLDHIVPVALGGSHTEDNLAVACLSCNTKKRANFLVMLDANGRSAC